MPALDSHLLPHLIQCSADRDPAAPALRDGARLLNYGELAGQVQALAHGLLALGLGRAERVGIYLDKRLETVVASFAAPAAGGVFVPINPILKAEQVGFIVRDCEVRVLITSRDRLATLQPVLAQCPSLRQVVLVDPPVGAATQAATHAATHAATPAATTVAAGASAGAALGKPAGVASGGAAGALAGDGAGAGWVRYADLLDAPARAGHRVIDTDMVAILYTSGSTGRPKGVVLSHRNMVAGAKSVASYLGNHAQDRLLAALPLSFDAGFSQLTTAFHSGASVSLLNYLMPRDVLKALERDRITGLTAVPPLYIQLTQLEWPQAIDEHLRYFANTGGRMPRETLGLLRQRVPSAKPFLMYGLTEAFRSTYLPPDEVDRRPDSIGKAIPNAEILVLREDGTPCAPDEPGELVHRGALVGLGYWNDAEKTAERYKLLPAGVAGREAGLQLPEYAVFSGDTVRMDAEGFLYFIGRRDEMIKTSGYRVSPTEVEEILYATQLVGECAAFGVAHPTLGQAIQVIATPPAGIDTLDTQALLTACRARMPAYMIPAGVQVRSGPLPRNPNGKIDRKLLSTEWIAALESDAKS